MPADPGLIITVYSAPPDSHERPGTRPSSELDRFERATELTVASSKTTTTPRKGIKMGQSEITTHARLFDLIGKRALVTGGTKGIGLMIARGLLQAGASVIISSRNAETCSEVQQQLSSFGDVEAIPRRPLPPRRVPASVGTRHRRIAASRNSGQQRGRHLG